MPSDTANMLEIHTMPGHLIRRLNQISIALFAETVGRAGFDLTPVQYAALSTIAAEPGLDQATLAGLIAYDRVTIGGVVDRLTQKGLVERTISPRDRRARVLKLTPKGNSVLAQIRPLVEETQTKILAGLSEEETAQFMALLAKTTKAGNALSRAPMRLPEGEG